MKRKDGGKYGAEGVRCRLTKGKVEKKRITKEGKERRKGRI